VTKKSHPLDGLSSILGMLKNEPATPTPAPPSPPPKGESDPVSEPPKGGKGRPATGKKSNGEYCQTTISIRKDTRKRVKQALLDAESGQDVSELVEELLSRWLSEI
jgi:hypothetical protein